MAKTIGFNARTKETEEKIQKQREERQKAMGGGDMKPKPRLKDGVNVIWMLPGMGETFEPVVDMLVHFGPFHRCLRDDPIPDEDKEGGFEKDGCFANCVRCQTAWNTWEGAGKSKGPAFSKFKGDMESHQAMMQVFVLTPFFKLDSSGMFAVPNESVVKEHFENYLNIIAEEDEDARNTLAESLKDDMPEDIIDAALASPGILATNSKVGRKIRRAYIKKCGELEADPLILSEDEDGDVIGGPDKWLIQIIRSDGPEKFKGRDGKQRTSYEYEVNFTTSKKLKKWKPDAERMQEIAGARGVDINNIEPASDSLQDRAFALEKFSTEDLKAYLEECGHTYDYRDGEEGGTAAGGEEGDFVDSDDIDPDDFEVETLSVDDQAESEDIKAQLKG